MRRSFAAIGLCYLLVVVILTVRRVSSPGYDELVDSPRPIYQFARGKSATPDALLPLLPITEIADNSVSETPTTTSTATVTATPTRTETPQGSVAHSSRQKLPYDGGPPAGATSITEMLLSNTPCKVDAPDKRSEASGISTLFPQPVEYSHGGNESQAVLGADVTVSCTLGKERKAWVASWLAFSLTSSSKCSRSATVTQIVSRSASDGGLLPNGDNEWFVLRVTTTRIEIEADTEFGEMHAFKALAQLVRRSGGCALIFGVPLTVRDGPRFRHRGLLVDPPRVFLEVGEVKHVLDLLALGRGNVLHLRLADDQHFRFASARFPLLVENEKEHYTPDVLRDLVKYAAARGVRVVPELGVPGHAKAWGRGGYANLTADCPMVQWSTTLDPTIPFTWSVIEGLLYELMAIFPDPLVHLGGDEISACWDNDAAVGERARKANIVGPLLDHFERRLVDLLKQPAFDGKVFVRWEDLEWNVRDLSGTYPKDRFVFQPWLSGRNVQRFIEWGYHAINSKDLYFDVWARDSNYNRKQAWREIYKHDFREMRHFQDVWKMPAELEPLLLGGEACMWDHGYHTYDVKVWPLMSAVMERMWSREDADDVERAFDRKLSYDDWIRALRDGGCVADPVREKIPNIPHRHSVTHPPDT